MLRTKIKSLISEVVGLYSISSLSQEIIDMGVKKLKEAKEILLSQDNSDGVIYKVVLLHPYTYTDYVDHMSMNSANGVIQENPYNYKVNNYIDVGDMKFISFHGNITYHVCSFYDENKKFIIGYNSNQYVKDSQLEVPQNAKYMVTLSGSDGVFPLVYGYTTIRPTETTFEHESNEEYIVTNVVELKSGNYKTGDVVITKGYHLEGDLGNAIYDIMTEEEYLYLMKKSAYIPKTTTQVDGYGNHTLNNGLVARLRIDNDDMRPEQWGAKGDGVTNDCQALVHMFAKITSGTVTFKEGATYLLGLYGGTVQSPTDNPYRQFGCGSLLGGQFFSKPILISAHDLKLNGNNCLITIPDNCFGNTGMGILNFSGHIKNVDLFNFRFDGKGRTLGNKNKNSNHTIFYSSCNVGEDEITLSLHPVGQGEKRSCIENFNIYNNHFFDAGAMYRQAGDWGGDHILIINPTELDGLNIHDNRFEAWGRWVFAIDLGGYGECLKNIKFNHNVCIGANAYEEVNEDGTFKYLIDMDKKEFLKSNPYYADAGLEKQLDNWRWRALGFIDFEAKKCFDNVELIGNTIIGSGGWAINGNSRLNKNFVIKDNYYKHVGGGYPYTVECYSGMTENWLVENNTFPGVCGFRMGYFTNGMTFKNNVGLKQIRTFGLGGNIVIENNDQGECGSPLTVLWSHEANLYENDPQFTREKVIENGGANVVYKNNEGVINAKFSEPDDIEKTSFINYDIELKYPTARANITELSNKIVIDPTTYEHMGQGVMYKGCRISKPVESIYILPSILYIEKGEVFATNCQNWSVVKGDLFRNKLIENFQNIYNCSWNNYAIKNNFKKISIVCTESGYTTGNCEYGFRDSCTHISYILKGNLNIQDNAYIATDDDVYWSKLGGKLTQVPTHKEGMATYTDENGNSIDLYYIGKVGKFELVTE